VKTQCPICLTIHKVPKPYLGRKIKCDECTQFFVVANYNFISKTDSSRLIHQTENFLTRFWKSTPIAFKTAFLATLGITSAIVISFYAYSHFFLRMPTRTIDTVQNWLAEWKLFPSLSFNVPGIFQGRYLTKYEFRPDINFNRPNLIFWLDETEHVVGLSIQWRSDSTNRPLDFPPDPSYSYRTGRVQSVFEEFTSFSFSTLKEEDFQPFETGQIFGRKIDHWTIIIERIPESNVRLNPKLPIIYIYTASARKW